MIRLKKKVEEANPPIVASVFANGDVNAESDSTAQPAKPAGLKILGGVGGKDASADDSRKVGKKRTPGEIRIQKGIIVHCKVLKLFSMNWSLYIDVAELDGGSAAKVVFPNPNDLTNFIVTVTPDSGYWKGAQYPFTFVIPALYPHEPPKVF